MVMVMCNEEGDDCSVQVMSGVMAGDGLFDIILFVIGCTE